MSYLKPSTVLGIPPKARGSTWGVRFISKEIHKPTAILLPLRVFIGISWLRAAMEKLLEPGWYDGSSVSTFLTGQMHSGAVAFPFYNGIITSTFLPHATLLGYIIVIGQVLAGLAIITGTLTSAALLGGIFMNSNFLLAGAPEPSAFYLIIQFMLLASQAGSVFSLDAVRRYTVRQALSPAQEILRRRSWHSRFTGSLYLALAALSLGGASAAFGYIKDFSPGGSVKDPAVITVVMLGVVSSYWIIAYLRTRMSRLSE